MRQTVLSILWQTVEPILVEPIPECAVKYSVASIVQTAGGNSFVEPIPLFVPLLEAHEVGFIS